MVCKSCKEKDHVTKTCIKKYKSLERVKNDDQCSICMSKTNKPKCKTKCGHCFHIVCLKEWLKSNVTCPMCRTVINNEKEDILNLIINELQEHINGIEDLYLIEDPDMIEEIVGSYFQNEFLI